MPRRSSGDRRHLSIRMDAGLLEALDETADEVMVSRSRLIELAVESYLQRVELPPHPAPVLNDSTANARNGYVVDRNGFGVGPHGDR